MEEKAEEEEGEVGLIIIKNRFFLKKMGAFGAPLDPGRPYITRKELLPRSPAPFFAIGRRWKINMSAHFGGGAEMADPVAVGNGFQRRAKAVEMKATEAIVALNHDGASAGGEANTAIFKLGAFIVVGAGAVPPPNIHIVPHLELTFIVHNLVVEDATLGSGCVGRRVAPPSFPLVVIVVVVV